MDAKLKRIRNSISKRRQEPRLFVDLDQLYATHGELAWCVNILVEIRKNIDSTLH
ncbi:MAG: hypothetical protein WCB94_06700 [Terriglobales bacterium]